MPGLNTRDESLLQLRRYQCKCFKPIYTHCVPHAGLFLPQLFFMGFNGCLMHACRGEPGDEAREKCPHVIASHVHEQYRECGNLPPVILEVKVVMNESLQM